MVIDERPFVATRDGGAVIPDPSVQLNATAAPLLVLEDGAVIVTTAPDEVAEKPVVDVFRLIAAAIRVANVVVFPVVPEDTPATLEAIVVPPTVRVFSVEALEVDTVICVVRTVVWPLMACAIAVAVLAGVAVDATPTPSNCFPPTDSHLSVEAVEVEVAIVNDPVRVFDSLLIESARRDASDVLVSPVLVVSGRANNDFPPTVTPVIVPVGVADVMVIVPAALVSFVDVAE